MSRLFGNGGSTVTVPTLPTCDVHPFVLQVTPHAVSGFSIKALRPGRGSVEFEYKAVQTGADLVAELVTAAEVTALGLQTAVISIGLLLGETMGANCPDNAIAANLAVVQPHCVVLYIIYLISDNSTLYHRPAGLLTSIPSPPLGRCQINLPRTRRGS